MAASLASASRSTTEVGADPGAGGNEPASGGPVRTWRLVLEYDGTPFNGWQHQPQGVCLQDLVERALAQVFAGDCGRVVASGRTDAGVHAHAQVVSFRTARWRDPAALRAGLNALLPPEVVCLEAAVAHDTFHAQHSALRKTYRYRLLTGRVRSALRRDQVWHIGWALDLEAMRAALALLEGTHDFSCFQAAGCSARSPVRTIFHARLTPSGDELHIELEGDGFLRHMVRNIVGTLVDVGRGRQPPGWVAELIAGRDRGRAGRTAPARGLALVEVVYPPELLERGAEAPR